jgi:hypothetical protein
VLHYFHHALKVNCIYRVQIKLAGKKNITKGSFLAILLLSSKLAHTSISVSGRTLGPQCERQEAESEGKACPPLLFAPACMAGLIIEAVKQDARIVSLDSTLKK